MSFSVSVCLASPVDFGWDEYGGAAFAKTCGEELWGAKPTQLVVSFIEMPIFT